MSSVAVLTRNTVANLLKPGISWLIVLVLPPLLVRVLDKPSYATWMLLLQLGAYISIVDLSIEIVVMHFVARARGLADGEYMGRTVSSAGLVLLVTGVVAALLCVLTAWQLPVLFSSIPPDILPSARGALVVVGGSLAMVLPFAILAGVFRGFQRNEIPAILTAIGKVVGSIGVGWAAYHHQGLMAMATWTACGNIIPRIGYVVVWMKWTKKRLIHFSRVTVPAIREFLGIWSAMLASQSCGIFITGLDMPVVAAFAFPSAAYYAVAATLSNMLIVPHSAIMDAMIPVMSGLSANAGPDRLGSALVRLTRYSTTALLLLTLPVLFGMSLFLDLWVTKNYSVHALSLAAVLVIAQFIRSTLGPYAITAFGSGEQKQTLISPIVEGAVNLAASLILVRRMGAIGVALGTLLGAVIGVLVHFTVSMRLTRALRVNRLQLISQGILRPMACCIPALLLFLAIQWANLPTVLHLLAIGLAETVAAAILFVGNFEPAERSQLIGWGKRCAFGLGSSLALGTRRGSS